MNTKEVCSRLSVTQKMLRVYEKQKLIHAERSENGYRNYSLDDLLQIQFVVMLRNLSFSLKEIKTVLNLKKTKRDYLYHFYIQQKAVETKINELTNAKEKLNSIINQLLKDENVNAELFDSISMVSINDPETTIYETMINRWNFDQMAVDYVNRFLKEDMDYQNSIRKAAEILKSLIPGKRVLDIGGGTCNLWIGFQQDTHLTVIDNSLQMIFAAKETLPWPNYILDDIIKIDLNRYEKFDIVVSTFTLHHIDYALQEKAIKNMIDLCTDKGSILIVDRSFRNQAEKEKVEKELTDTGNTEFLDVIHSEFYLDAEHIVNFIRYLGYPVRTLFFEDQAWGFLIEKNIE